MNDEPATEVYYNKSFSLEEIARDIEITNVGREAEELARKYGYLPYMIQRYIEMLGYEETLELLKAFENFRRRPAILCNHLKIDCEQLVERLSRMGFELRTIPWCDIGYVVVKSASSPTLGATHEYLKGYYYVYRDSASLVPVIALSPRSGSTVLDLCAAPGGKSVHILIRMKDHGLLFANDASRARLKSLATNLFRMGFKSYVVLSEDGISLSSKISIRFNYVLLDAPCSAEGAIMFDKSRKTKTTQKDLVKLVVREIRLLLSAIKLASCGARIVYTTCSIAPEENEYVITKVMDLLGKNVIDVEDVGIGIGDRGLTRFRDMKFNSKLSRCIRIWPHRHLMEGYFVCVLRKLREIY